MTNPRHRHGSPRSSVPRRSSPPGPRGPPRCSSMRTIGRSRRPRAGRGVATSWPRPGGPSSASSAAPRAVAAPVVLEEDRPEGVVRQLIRYEAEPGLPVEGYLLRPEGPATGRPGVVVLHSTVDYTIRQPAGLEGPEDKHIGLHLARRGYVAFCPRCFLWQYGGPGRYGEAVTWLRRRHPGVTGMAKMLFDAVRAVDVLASQPDVDRRPDRRDRPFAGGEGGPLPRRLRSSGSGPRSRARGGSAWPTRTGTPPGISARRSAAPASRSTTAQVLALAAPRAFLLIGGDSADGDASWPYDRGGAPGLVAARRRRRGRPVQPSPGARLPRDRPGPRL